MHLLIDCPMMEQYRASCGLGSFIRVHRMIKPGLSSIKLFALFLNDRDSTVMYKRALDLYTMKLGWHSLMGIEL